MLKGRGRALDQNLSYHLDHHFKGLPTLLLLSGLTKDKGLIAALFKMSRLGLKPPKHSETARRQQKR